MNEPRCEPDENVDVEFWVADIVDAQWIVPIEPKERRFFCCKLRGQIYIFLRATQGSRGEPLLWGPNRSYVGEVRASHLLGKNHLY